jgi:hypothetical protein
MNKNAYREWLLKLIVTANPKGGGLINVSGPCTSNHSNDSDQEMRNICTSRNHLRCSYSKKVCGRREDRAPDGNATTPKAWH